MKKIIKFVFIALLLLAAVAVILTLAFTKDYKVITLKRSVDVNATREQVFDYISHTENKAQWLSDADKKIVRSSTGKDATVGFVRRWEIQNPPEKGSETITKIEDGTRIETLIENNLNGTQTNSRQALSCISADGGKTMLTWEREAKIPLNFMARMLLGFSEMLSKSVVDSSAYEDGIQRGLENKGVYKDMDEILQRLKNSIEEKYNSGI